jgi:hypothetical protein
VKDISGKAYGFLAGIWQHGLNISAESMMEHFKVGRWSALSGLKELRVNGYIKTEKQRVNNRIITVSKLTQKAERALFGMPGFVESGNRTPVTRNRLIKQNNKYSTVISNKQSLAEPKEEFTIMELEVNDMGWGGLFDNTSDPTAELKEEIAKDKKIKDGERREANDKKKADQTKVRRELQGDRRTFRERKEPKDWRVVDVCFEFADRIDQHFHIEPWKVNQSQFSGALAGLRGRLGTNGELEIAVMDIFFRQINISEYKDAEVLWRLYVSRFASLIGEVKMSQVSDETQKVAEESMVRAMKEFGNIV